MFQTLLSFVIGLASGVVLTLLILHLRERLRIKKLQHSKTAGFTPEMDELTTWAPDLAWNTEPGAESALAETAAVALRADTESQKYQTTIALDTAGTTHPEAATLPAMEDNSAQFIPQFALEVAPIEFTVAADSAPDLQSEIEPVAAAESWSEASPAKVEPIAQARTVLEAGIEAAELQPEPAPDTPLFQKTDQETDRAADLADELARELAAQVEAELAAQLEAEQAARVEAELAAQVEAELAAQVEAERVAQAEAEQAARVEAELAAQVEAELAALASAAEQAKQAALDLELSRLEAARIAQEEQERANQEALEQQQAELEAAQLEAARLEAARLEAAQLEAAQLEAAQLEAARLAAEEREATQLEAEWQTLQAERQAQLALEAEQAEILRQQQEQQVPTPPAAVKTLKAPADTIILVADDSKVVRVKTSRVLAKHTYQVNLAEDGIDAANQIAFALPDVLVTDVEMPGMDGFALTLHLRNNPATAHLPIIMISGASDELADKARQAGVNVLLGKPYADEDLIAHIQRLVQDAPL